MNLTGRSGSNSAENEWCAAAVPAANAASTATSADLNVMTLVLPLSRAILVADVLQMLEILVVLVARDLEQLVGLAMHRHLDRPRASVRDRVGDRRAVDDRVLVYRCEALDDGFHVAHDVADFVEPRLAVEVGAFDDERVAIPMTPRIALPQANVVGQRRPRAHRDVPPRHALEQHDDVAGRLENVHGLRHVMRARDA